MNETTEITPSLKTETCEKVFKLALAGGLPLSAAYGLAYQAAKLFEEAFIE